MQIETLIALVDGSSYGQVLCQYAGWLASRANAAVKLYHVLDEMPDPNQQDLSGALALGARSTLLQELSALDAERAKLQQAHGRAILEDAAKLLKANHPKIDVETRLRQGNVLETLEAKENRGDLILIGKRGTHSANNLQEIGAHVEALIHASHRPVFIANRSFNPIERMVIAFDDTEMAKKSVELIAQTSAFNGLPVDLICAAKPTAQIEQHMEEAARAFDPAQGVRKIIKDGATKDVLTQHLNENKNSCLVMGAYTHSKLRRMLLGSNTAQLMQSALVPIIVAR